MPNWVHTEVSMEGKKETINEILSKYFDENGCIDFNKITPQPKTKEECPEEFICDCEKNHLDVSDGRDWFNWFAWNIAHWGVKWSACQGWTEIGNDMFGFYSPWDCPLEVLKTLSGMYPEVLFEILVDGEIPRSYFFRLQNGNPFDYDDEEEDELDWGEDGKK